MRPILRTHAWVLEECAGCRAADADVAGVRTPSLPFSSLGQNLYPWFRVALDGPVSDAITIQIFALFDQYFGR